MPARTSGAVAIAMAAVLLLALPASAGPADLDPTFSGDGWDTQEGLGLEIGWAVASYGDLLYVVGDTQDNSSGQIMVARYTATGSLDTAFAGDGIAYTSGGGWTVPTDATVQSDGKLVVAGTAGTRLVVVRYRQNGTLDARFSDDGKALVRVAKLSTVQALAIDSAGRILVAGNVRLTDDLWDHRRDGFVVRLRPNGTLDGSFGRNGVARADFAKTDTFQAITVDGRDRPVVAGGTGSPLQLQGSFLVGRFRTDGRVDGTFGRNGRTLGRLSPSSSDDGFGVGTDGANRVYVGISSSLNGGYGFGVARLTSAGALDGTFANGGKRRVACLQECSVYDASWAPSGMLFSGGGGGTGVEQLFVARITKAGAADATLGAGGQVVHDLPSEVESGWAITQMANGKLAIGGNTTDGSDTDLLAVRLGT